MRLIQAKEVQALTGLSQDQLREWTRRRGLIPPDIIPQGPGSRALFSWQTVLLLRIAVVLKEKLHVELQAYRENFAKLRCLIAEKSFLSLGGSGLLLLSDGSVKLTSSSVENASVCDGLFVQLDPHLGILSTGFGEIEASRQLPLFPISAVR